MNSLRSRIGRGEIIPLDVGKVEISSQKEGKQFPVLLHDGIDATLQFVNYFTVSTRGSVEAAYIQ